MQSQTGIDARQTVCSLDRKGLLAARDMTTEMRLAVDQVRERLIF
jgi:hypothetical protein